MLLKIFLKFKAILLKVYGLPKKINELNEKVKKLENKLYLPEPSINVLGIGLDLGKADNSKIFDSDICRFEDFAHPEYKEICENIFKMPPYYQRKQWEWVYIYYHLRRLGFLKKGIKGLGFGVGKERLPSILTSLGCQILATDAPSEFSQEWKSTSQHSENLSSLLYQDIVDPMLFESNCRFTPLNMNNYASIPEGFDFHWSSCVIEHLGGISSAIEFVLNSSLKLNSGGIGIHTTEFNLTSNTSTLDQPGTCILRKKDIENLSKELESKGLSMKKVIYDPGTHFYNYQIDTSSPPGPLHLRVLIENNVCTSMGLIIMKNNSN